MMPQFVLEGGPAGNPRGLPGEDTNRVSSAFWHAGTAVELVALVEPSTEWSLQAEYHQTDYLEHGLGNQALGVIRCERWTMRPGQESALAVALARYEDSAQPENDRTTWMLDAWRRVGEPEGVVRWLMGAALEGSDYVASGEQQVLIQGRAGPRLQVRPSWSLLLEGSLATALSGAREDGAGLALNVEGELGPRCRLMARGAFDSTTYGEADPEWVQDQEERWSAEAEVRWRWRPGWEWFGRAGWSSYEDAALGGTVEEVSGGAGMVLTFERILRPSRK